MNKKFRDFSFDNVSFENIKDDIDNINNMFDDLMNDSKIKKIYNKIKKIEEKDIQKISYNNVNEDNGFNFKIIKNKEIKLNIETKTNDYKNKKTRIIFG